MRSWRTGTHTYTHAHVLKSLDNDLQISPKCILCLVLFYSPVFPCLSHLSISYCSCLSSPPTHTHTHTFSHTHMLWPKSIRGWINGGCLRASLCFDFFLWLCSLACSVRLLYRFLMYFLKKKHRHTFANVCTSVCFTEDSNQWMLNNAAFCRMPLLPDNIPISDSGFENVNAFNKVNPHLHQTGETAEAPTDSCKRRKHVWPWGTKILREAEKLTHVNTQTRHQAGWERGFEVPSLRVWRVGLLSFSETVSPFLAKITEEVRRGVNVALNLMLCKQKVWLPVLLWMVSRSGVLAKA